MAGFMSPGLGFASTVGAFIGGAAKQANANIEAANAQHAQDEKIWIAKFAKSMEDYEKAEDDRKKTNGVWQAAKDVVGARGADRVVQLWQAYPKKDISELIEQVKAANPPNEPNYQSQVLGDLDSSLQRRYQGLANIRQNMRPNMQRMFPMPQEPSQYGGSPTGSVGTGGDYFNPSPNPMPSTNQSSQINSSPLPSQTQNSSPGVSKQVMHRGPNGKLVSEDNFPYPEEYIKDVPKDTRVGTFNPNNPTGSANVETDSGNFSGGSPSVTSNAQVAQNNAPPLAGFGGMNKQMVNGIMGKDLAVGFKDKEGEDRYIASVRANPFSPDKWDRSGMNKVQQKLDPTFGPVMQEVTKAISYIDNPEDRRALQESLREAQRTGDSSVIRYDLIPSREQMAEKDNTLAAGKEAGKKYVDELEKRGTTVSANKALSFAADRIINTVTNSSGPLQASSLQPMLDEVNRFFGAAGVDLRSLGLPANRIEDTNMLKKVLGDMTFQQISQYHLGRWTNYEVGLLKQKLPSIDTSPVNMVQVALLFKNAADKEISTYVKEHELAYGPNGEYLFNPRNLGQAKMAGAKALQEGKVPWLEVSNYNNPTKHDEDAWSKMPVGTWIEDRATGSMILKLENNNVKIVPNQVGAR